MMGNQSRQSCSVLASVNPIPSRVIAAARLNQSLYWDFRPDAPTFRVQLKHAAFAEYPINVSLSQSFPKIPHVLCTNSHLMNLQWTENRRGELCKSKREQKKGLITHSCHCISWKQQAKLTSPAAVDNDRIVSITIQAEPAINNHQIKLYHHIRWTSYTNIGPHKLIPYHTSWSVSTTADSLNLLLTNFKPCLIASTQTITYSTQQTGTYRWNRRTSHDFWANLWQSWYEQAGRGASRMLLISDISFCI